MTVFRRTERGLTPCGPSSWGNHAVFRVTLGSDPAKEVEQFGN
jgi:hypothetical protein